MKYVVIATTKSKGVIHDKACMNLEIGALGAVLHASSF